MKLKTFNTVNITNEKTVSPTVSMNKSTGNIGFNAGTIKLLKLKPGSMVNFVQDEENTEDWYLETVTKDGFAVKLKKDTEKYLFFSSRVLVDKIFTSLDCQRKTGGRCLVAGEATEFEGRKLYAILTIALKN